VRHAQVFKALLRHFGKHRAETAVRNKTAPFSDCQMTTATETTGLLTGAIPAKEASAWSLSRDAWPGRPSAPCGFAAEEYPFSCALAGAVEHHALHHLAHLRGRSFREYAVRAGRQRVRQIAAGAERLGCSAFSECAPPCAGMEAHAAAGMSSVGMVDTIETSCTGVTPPPGQWPANRWMRAHFSPAAEGRAFLGQFHAVRAPKPNSRMYS